MTAFHGKSKLKKAALNMLVKQRSEDKNKLAHSVFVKIDCDKSGAIDKDELVMALKKS